MVSKVKVVTAFVPLNVLHMDAAKYHDLGQQMLDATDGRYRFFDNFPIEACWSHDICAVLPPAGETPADRYASQGDHVRSHIVQHTRTQWALQALDEDPDTDWLIWLDLGILKQGKHTGKLITPDDVRWFCDIVSMYPNADIPFPGITGPDPWLPHGNNWRFCGSTHVWPAKLLPQIHRSYATHLINFTRMYQSVPLDLAIWPLVERNSGLPFKWYPAEYDNTQLRNFPCAL